MRLQDLIKQLPKPGSVSKPEELMAVRELYLKVAKMVMDAAEVRHPGVEKIVEELIRREEELSMGEANA